MNKDTVFSPLSSFLPRLFPPTPLYEERDLSRFFSGYQGAFVLLDVARNHGIRYNPPQCSLRLPPCSTFKIVNSLIALETGVAGDANFLLKWDGRKRPIADWNRDHTLQSAFKASAVWYYQALAARIGSERMQKYVRRIPYGNQDLSGGITKFWLESSLTISADEQVAFLRRLHQNDLPFSKRSQNIVKEMMILSRSGGTVFRGKTGTGGDLERNVATLGWFVGYVTTRGNAHVFATNIRGGKNSSGRTARRITEEILRSRNLL